MYRVEDGWWCLRDGVARGLWWRCEGGVVVEEEVEGGRLDEG